MGHSHTNTHKFKSLKKAGSSRYIFRNEIDSTYFQDDIAYVDFKDLPRRTVCDKLLPDKAFEIAKNISMMNINLGLHQWSTNFLIRRLEIQLLIQKKKSLKIKNWSMDYINLSIENLKTIIILSR